MRQVGHDGRCSEKGGQTGELDACRIHAMTQPMAWYRGSRWVCDGRWTGVIRCRRSLWLEDGWRSSTGYKGAGIGIHVNHSAGHGTAWGHLVLDLRELSDMKRKDRMKLVGVLVKPVS